MTLIAWRRIIIRGGWIEMKMRTLLQSNREYTDFEDFTVFGSQFGYGGGVEWHVGLWSESDKPLRVFCVAGGVPEERLSGKRLEAVQAAIREWEADPVWVE